MPILRLRHHVPALYFALMAGLAPLQGHTEPATPPATATAPADDGTARVQESHRIRKERGLRVCRESADGTLRFTGVTQNDERRLVQILVTRIVRTDSGEVVGGVRETSVWDGPENWRLCPG